MKKSIVYVRTSLWGAKAVQDLLAQENSCLAYAQTNSLQVARVFREKPWKRRGKGELSAMLQYLQKNEGKLDFLVIHSPPHLARYKMDFIPLLKKIRGLGVKVAFVKN